jgi:nitrate reductase beta subunit
MGVLLYDADRIEEVATVPDGDLVEAQRSIIQDPFDPAVIAAAKENGISDEVIASAQNSPVYKFVKEWKVALPLHPEFRTVPMLFYVPPMLPVLAAMKNEKYEIDGAESEALAPLLSSLEQARMPMRYMANLFAGGNVEIVNQVYRKLIATRIHMRGKTVQDLPADEIEKALAAGNTTAEEVEAMYRLTALPTYDERFVIPPMEREEAVAQTVPPSIARSAAGFGSRKAPERRW